MEEAKNKIDWKTICVFGASTTWGAWDFEKGGWVNRLMISESEKEDGYEVYNLGISGDFASDVLARFETEAKARKPNIILFSVGDNDSIYVKSEDKQIVDIKKFEENLQKLVDLAKKYTNKIVFLSCKNVDESKTTPIPWETDYHYIKDKLSLYSKKIKQITEKNNILYLNIFKLLNNEDYEDGLHPNTQGHEKIFQEVKNFLEENKLIK